MEELAKTKRGVTKERWQRAIKDKAFDLIRDLPILETQAEHFLKVLNTGTVSTNVFLRRAHNFALDMGWLPWPVVVKRQWPAIEFKEKRAITWKEHCQIIERENNPERKAFYQMAWHLGASQSDLAFLEAENVDWEHHVISFARMKTGSIAIMRFGEDVAEILRDLPGNGPLFPYLRSVRAGDRASPHKEDIMQSWQIKALELEQSVLKFLDGVIADYGLYIFMGLAFLLIPILAWVLSGGLQRTLLKGKPVPHVTAVIGVQIPIGRPTPPPEPFDPFPPDCGHDEH